MRYDEEHESSDLIDERGRRAPSADLSGLLWYIGPWLLRSWPGRIVLVGIVGFMLYQRFAPVSGNQVTENPGGGSHVTDKEAHFIAFVLDDVQHSWEVDFAARNLTYRHAKLVLFTDATDTGCGYGDSATGPFYCPRDERVYIDLGFYHELEQRLGMRGEFAEAYVVGHEIGHHVQKLLGTNARHANPTEGANGTSVRMELQADCYAGIWAHSTAKRDILEKGDIESALKAASAIGDDQLQRQSTGRVRPDTFTHGTSDQRVRWFKRGYDSGKIEECDTFSASPL
jgi:predicted metalloprotease